MLAILWFLLKLLLGIVVVLLVIVLLLLHVRTGFEVTGMNGELVVDLRYGALKLPIWPPPVKKKEQDDTRKEKTKESTQDKPKRPLQVDVNEILSLSLEIMPEFVGKLEIRRLEARIIIASDDAAKTGMLYGSVAAILGMIQPFLLNHFSVMREQIQVEADFEADSIKWAVHIWAVIRPIEFIKIILRHFKEFKKLYRDLTKKEEAKQV